MLFVFVVVLVGVSVVQGEGSTQAEVVVGWGFCVVVVLWVVGAGSEEPSLNDQSI